MCNIDGVQYHGLIEGAPLNLDPRAVGQALAAVPSVALVPDLHLWRVRADETLLGKAGHGG